MWLNDVGWTTKMGNLRVFLSGSSVLASWLVNMQSFAMHANEDVAYTKKPFSLLDAYKFQMLNWCLFIIVFDYILMLLFLKKILLDLKSKNKQIDGIEQNRTYILFIQVSYDMWGYKQVTIGQGRRYLARISRKRRKKNIFTLLTMTISIIVTINIPVWSLQSKGDNRSRDGLSSATCSC